MQIASIRDTALFKNMTDEEIQTALNGLSVNEKAYCKDEIILHAGSVTPYMGLVLSGSVTIENTDLWGNRTILSQVGAGHFFAETYALLKEEPLLVDVTANSDCTILFLRIGSLAELSSRGSAWSVKLITNLLGICARKNLMLSGRSFHTSPKTIRGRVMSYLNAFALKSGSNEFDIPFNRQQLSDYLNLERSALSKELGKMQRDGLISVKKNHFLLHDNA